MGGQKGFKLYRNNSIFFIIKKDKFINRILKKKKPSYLKVSNYFKKSSNFTSSIIDNFTYIGIHFFNILSWTWNEISKNRDEEIILVIDEAYILIDKKNKGGIDFVKNTSKRIRKYNGSMIIISQNLIDFLDEEIARYGQVIIDNSTYFFAMVQGNKEITAVKDLLNLSQSEVSFLTKASKGQCLLSISQDTKIPIQVYINEFDKALFGKGGGR